MDHPDIKLHEPNECTDSLYGRDCDGIGHWGEDPYAAEMYDEHFEEYICYGAYTGRVLDI